MHEVYNQDSTIKANSNARLDKTSTLCIEYAQNSCSSQQQQP